MKSEVRRSDFNAFRFSSFRKNSELSSTKQNKKGKKKREILNIDLKGKPGE